MSPVEDKTVAFIHTDRTSVAGTGSSHDPMIDKIMPGIANAGSVRAHNPGVPACRFGQHGTTVYKPSRCEVEMEAIYGKHVYKNVLSPDSPEATRQKTAGLEAQVSTLSAQVNALLAALNVKSAEPTPAPEPEPEVAVAEKVSKNPGLDDYRDLQARAKKLGIDSKQKRPALEAAIAEIEG